MDLTARPQPRTFWELFRCCKNDAADGDGDDFHNTTSQVCISTLDKDLSVSITLDSPHTQSTLEADEDGQIFNDDISEASKEEAVTIKQSSSSSIDKEWHQQCLKAAIDNNEKPTDEFKDESFDDASVIFDNLTDFAEQLHQEVDTAVSNMVDALYQ
eukprot:scaffold17822_cov99-Skeletonema_dohrnii-CCMP3373.AAC.2